jgi:hypothetical protein
LADFRWKIALEVLVFEIEPGQGDVGVLELGLMSRTLRYASLAAAGFAAAWPAEGLARLSLSPSAWPAAQALSGAPLEDLEAFLGRRPPRDPA